ncbi:MAG: hypothetical protein KDK70_27070 [Myxococcales bacterium]|nr:hypothetical protein [Myxococcales bacterium]
MACGHEPEPSADDGATDGGTMDSGGPITPVFEGFSAADLEVIRTQLGPLPEGVPPDPTNAYVADDAAAELGRRFYYDQAFSVDGKVSCATCHDPETGFQDARGDPTSEGTQGFTDRHAPTVINSAFGPAAEVTEGTPQFWDGRVDSLWAQALGPPENSIEMGAARGLVVRTIIDAYREDYEAVFGALPPELLDGQQQPVFSAQARPGTPEWDALPAPVQDAVTRVYVHFGKAIAAFESRVTCRDSRFDDFWREIAAGAEDSDLLTDQEKIGLLLFVRTTGEFDRGYGGCIECHTGPNFSNWDYKNLELDQTSLGEPLPPVDEGRFGGVAKLVDSEFHCASPWSDMPDKSACSILAVDPEAPELSEMIGRFKTPGLRCVSMTAPYMHTGSMETLEDVIDHYALGGHEQGFAGKGDIDPLALTADEREALVAFLQTLDGSIPDWTKQGT